MIAALLSLLVWIAVQMELSRFKIAHKIWNIPINFIIGLIPILGDAVDIFKKANMKNLKILTDHAKSHPHVGRVIQPQHYTVAK